MTCNKDNFITNLEQYSIYRVFHDLWTLLQEVIS